MAKYVPSGRVGGAGILMTLGFGLVTAAVAAVLFHFVGRFFYLVIMFPLVWGLAIGAAVAAGIRIGKCRNTVVGLAAGILASVVSFGAFQALENHHVRSSFKEAFSKEMPGEEIYDAYLQKEHGSSGFMGQLAARAEMGMNISRRGRGGSDKKPMISGTGVYVYWLVELAIIAGVCGYLSLAAVREPFCEKCLAWYQTHDIGGIVAGKVEEVRRAIVSKEFGRVPPCLVRTNPGGSLELSRCVQCVESPVVVKIESVTVDNKGKEQRSTVHEEMLAAGDAQALVSALEGPVTPSAQAPGAT